MNKIIIIMIFTVFLTACYHDSDSVMKENVEFDLVVSSFYPINTPRQIEVIETFERIDEIIRADELNIIEALGEIDVDFETEIAVFVLMGNQVDAGFSIQIGEIYREEDYLVVSINHNTNTDCSPPQAIINPYTIVKFENPNRPIIFKEKFVKGLC